MKVINQQEYDSRKAINDDSVYGTRIFSYAEDWADLIADQMSKGFPIEEVAAEAGRRADYDGITGFMYSSAAKIISEHWIHGELFRRWFNIENQIGTEGELANEKGQILNTAILTISRGVK